MACYHPIPAAQYDPGGPVELHPPYGEAHIDLPCGACLGCRTARASDWAKRAMDEAKSHEHNCFVTLTYDQEHVPNGLVPSHLQKFFKRLRRAIHRRVPGIASDTGASVRYLSCGEYGEITARPHYHALLFNVSFTDEIVVGKHLTESPALGKLWPYGAHKIGTLTGASANYVAQYTLKSQGKVYHTPDGELLQKPFFRMSLKPAIGKTHALKYKNDYTHGYVIIEGKKARIPRAYLRWIQQTDPYLYEQICYHTWRAPRNQDNKESAERIHHRRRELAAKSTL